MRAATATVRAFFKWQDMTQFFETLYINDTRKEWLHSGYRSTHTRTNLFKVLALLLLKTLKTLRLKNYKKCLLHTCWFALSVRVTCVVGKHCLNSIAYEYQRILRYSCILSYEQFNFRPFFNLNLSKHYVTTISRSAGHPIVLTNNIVAKHNVKM